MDSKPLLLIVDDDPNFLEIFSAQLGAFGFRVQTAADGQQGIERAKIDKPDLIISDMHMPGMSGSDMIAKIKDDPETKDIKTILLSSMATAEEQAAQNHFAEWIGALGYLSKSEDLNSIVGKIKSFLSA